MPRAHRLPAVRLCLLFLAAVLFSAAVLALAASADPSRAAAASLPATGVSVPAAQSVSKQRASNGKVSRARRAECAAAARAKEHRRARKACAVKQGKGKKPSASPRSAGTAPTSSPSVASSSAPALVIAGPPPAEALVVPAPEATPPAETPGGSGTPPAEPPVEPEPPVESKAPIERIPPVEEAKPPGEEPVLPVEEAKPPVEEPVQPVEEARPPVEEIKAPLKELIPPVEGSKPPVEVPPTEKASTTTTLVSSTNPSMVRQPVTYTATVSPAAAAGTVAFDEAGTPIAGCTAQLVSSGTATCILAGYATAGEHAITATYGGDGSYLASASSASKQVVDKTGTTKATMTLASSSDPSTVGEAVTYTITITPAAATGTVQFEQAGAAIGGCSAQPVSSGAARCTVANLVAGGHWVTAVYSGNSDYGSSTFSGLTQTVNKKTTTTTVSSSLDPSTVGQAVTFTATVSAAAATGTVSFNEAGVPITGCAVQPVSSGTATCAVAGPIAGGHGITAVYSGDSNYAVSRSAALTQTVNKKTTTTAVSSSLDPSTVGQAVTFTATVSAAAATGTVEFEQAGVTISGCAAQAVSSGTATCTVANLAVGWHGITAVYSGGSSYAVSWSPGLTQTVNKKATTTIVSSSLNPSTVGEAVTYTATVSPAAATGAVSFDEAGTPIAGCTAQPISSGTATCPVMGYPSWSSYTITAAYSGDSSYLASVSSVFTQTVEPPGEHAAPFRFFSPTSFWNEELPADAPLDPSSAGVIGTFNKLIAAEEQAGHGGPWINTTEYSVPIYTVPADQPTVTVTLHDHPANPALSSAWSEVPLPPNAQPAIGTDGELVVWQPSTGKLWEFWRLMHEGNGWDATWGGVMQNVYSDPGVYGPEAWPQAQSWWGASASSLSLVGGLISLEDLEKGQINHAISMSIPDVRMGVYASPAQRSDGTSTDPLSLPEGAHLRLNPSLNLAALHLPRLTLMLAEAAQRYGIFVRDHSKVVAFQAQDPTPSGTNPYTGSHGYFEGKNPSQVLAAFPWSQLELVKMELHEAGEGESGW